VVACDCNERDRGCAVLNQSVTVAAYAKINWTLDVHSLREDGYHNISSVMQRIKLCDWLTISTEGQGIDLSIFGPEASGVPTDERNIVWRAIEMLRLTDLKVAIEKNIPNQAGLGGGSSDCAAILLATNKLYDLKLTTTELAEIGKSLGADVPFFLQAEIARVDGIGDIVTAIEPFEPVEILLFKPDIGVVTGEAFEAFDAVPGRRIYDISRRWPSSGPSNDFEDVVYSLYPAVREARDAMMAAGLEHTLLCGSGSTVMGWGGDLASAASSLRTAGHKNIWLTQTI
jgi:4-diphosphocytidyl-2-C-methyl-D-erythritol kinase